MAGDLEERVRRLEQEVARVRRLEQEVMRLRQVVAPPPAPHSVPSAPATVPVKAPAPPPIPGVSTGVAGDAEFRFGARWLLIAGIVVFVLGAVFFLKLAIDYGWIRPLVQILFGVLLGVAMWGLGIYLDRGAGMVAYGQRLSGGGAIILYFSVFAAYFFPTYRNDIGMTLEADAVLLGIVALLLAGDAAWRHAQPLAATAVGLVATTTLAAGAWEAFSVLYVVNATIAVVAVSLWRRWPAVVLASLPVAYVALLVHLIAGVDEQLILVSSLLLLVLYSGAGFISRAGPAGPPFITAWIQAFAWLASWPLISITLAEQVAWDAWGWTTLALGLTSASLAFAPVAPAASRWAWGGLAYFFLAIWPLLHLEGVLVTAAWSAEILLAVVLARWLRHGFVTAAPLPLGFLALVRLVQVEYPELIREEISAAVGMVAFMVPAFALGVAWLVPFLAHDKDRTFGRLALGGALLFPLFYLAAVLEGPAITLSWTAIGTTLLVIGFGARVADLRIAGVAIFAPVLLRIFTRDLADVDPVWRVLAFLGVGGVLLVVSFAYARMLRRQKRPSVRPAPTRPPR